MTEEIVPNEAVVGLADIDERLAGRMMRRARHVQTPVRAALALQGDVEHWRDSISPQGRRVQGRDWAAPP